jgi:hypothetical protein
MVRDGRGGLLYRMMFNLHYPYQMHAWGVASRYAVGIGCKKMLTVGYRDPHKGLSRPSGFASQSTTLVLDVSHNSHLFCCYLDHNE